MDNTKTLASSFLCGTDLDEYLKNPAYVGPFNNGTKRLNKYIARLSCKCKHCQPSCPPPPCPPCLTCKAKRKKPSPPPCPPPCTAPCPPPCGSPGCRGCCSNKPPPPCCEPPPCCPPPSPPPCCVPPPCPPPCDPCPPPCPKPKPKKYNLNVDQYADEPECPDCAAMKCFDPVLFKERKRQQACNWIGDRGKSFLKQIQTTMVKKLEVDPDPYLPSQCGLGWIIATKKPPFKKSKYILEPYDAKIMLRRKHSGHDHASSGRNSRTTVALRTDSKALQMQRSEHLNYILQDEDMESEPSSGSSCDIDSLQLSHDN